MSGAGNGQDGATIALSRVESALVQLAHDVRAREMAQVEADFAARVAAVRAEHGVPLHAPVHLLPHPQTPGVWVLFVPGMLPPAGAPRQATVPQRFGVLRNGAAPVDDGEAEVLARLRAGEGFGSEADEDTGPSGDALMAALAADGVDLGRV